jgi:hypothetical protein
MCIRYELEKVYAYLWYHAGGLHLHTWAMRY